VSRKADKVVWCRQGWYPVAYAFVPSEKAWRAEMRRMNATDDYPTSDARTVTFEKDGSMRIFVTCAERLDGRDPMGIVCLLVHEAVHVWQQMCEHCGDRDASHETEAYAIQRISGELMAAYANTRMRT
jgi:hypothetical protein